MPQKSPRENPSIKKALAGEKIAGKPEQKGQLKKKTKKLTKKTRNINESSTVSNLTLLTNTQHY